VILSLLVVTLTFFTDLDEDELSAYNDINTLSASYQQKKEIEEYINKLINYKIKSRVKKVDIESIKDKYYRVMNRNRINIELKKNYANINSFNHFIKKLRDITETKLGILPAEFRGMWEVEESVRILNFNNLISFFFYRLKTTLTLMRN